MQPSPRIRRLHSDRKALEQLQADSSIFRFEATGDPPDFYRLRFYGKGLARHAVDQPVVYQDVHEVHMRLGANYPRVMPELSWKTPIFHPNISASGFICLGGYGTHWTPGVKLDELCVMLWDMIRYENYDIASPYNREAAAWVNEQVSRKMPLDHRPLRDRLAASLPSAAATNSAATTRSHSSHRPAVRPPNGPPRHPAPLVGAPLPHAVRNGSPGVPLPMVSDPGVIFLDSVVEAEIVAGDANRVATGEGDILFIN